MLVAVPIADRRQSVLVVDDNLLNVELFVAYLGGLDCTTLTAANGKEALDAVERHRPDLVLLDVMMPDIDGFEVCRRIKSSNASSMTPVVLVTALANHSARVRGLDAGADEFLTKPIDRYELMVRCRSLLRMKSLYDSLDDAERVIFALARAVEAKDPFTETHTERVGFSARSLGAALGLGDLEQEDLYRGGIVHDIGKIGIPDSILLKPGPLDAAEVETMRRHVLIGEDIVRPLRSAAALVPIVRHHHERVDGTGYPDGLRGERIPLFARIVAVCDAYDAMVTTRAYRRGLGVGEARSVLESGSGIAWDGDLVRLFLDEVAPAVSAAS
jgi:putative two-component system response regulator